MPQLSVSVNWAYVVAPIFLLGLLVAAYASMQNMLIKEVELQGDFRIWSEQSVMQQVDWAVGEKFFSLDLDKVYSNLIAMPLIDQVNITKKWPGSLQIEISEAIPMAVWNREKIISSSGRVSDIPFHFDTSNLAVINSQFEYLNDSIKSFTLIQSEVSQKSVKINELTRHKTGSISLLLDNGWDIHLGRKDINLRVQRLNKLITKIAQDDISNVDLRYGQGVAVQWREKSEEQG